MIGSYNFLMTPCVLPNFMRMTLVACLVFTGVVGASKASNTGYPVTDSWAAVDAVRAMTHAEITRDVELLELLLADGYKEITSHGEVMNRKDDLPPLSRTTRS